MIYILATICLLILCGHLVVTISAKWLCMYLPHKEIDFGPNSNPKVSSKGEDCPRSY